MRGKDSFERCLADSRVPEACFAMANAYLVMAPRRNVFGVVLGGLSGVFLLWKDGSPDREWDVACLQTYLVFWFGTLLFLGFGAPADYLDPLFWVGAISSVVACVFLLKAMFAKTGVAAQSFESKGNSLH